MIWFLLQKMFFFVFLILTIFFVYRKKYENLLALYFWGMTFATCYYFAFTIWFPSKIVVLGMMICLIFNGFQRKSVAMQIIFPFISIFMIVLLLSDVVGVLFHGEYAPHIDKFIRMFNSNYTYITTAALLFFGMLLEKGFVKRIYPKYCLAVEVGIIIGLIHFICLKTGAGFMPILRQDGSVNLEALAQMGGNGVPRIYGVSGEPKNLGFLVCPYLLMSLVMLGQRMYRVNKSYHLIFMVMGLFVLINTYSSSALLNFFLAIPIIILLVPLPKLTMHFATIIVCCCLCGTLWMLKQEIVEKPDDGRKNFSEQLYERTFKRAQNEMDEGRQESTILDTFFNKDTNMVFLLFGWGASQYTFYVPGQVVGNALIPVQSGLVLTLTDFGIFGILLLIMLAFILIKLLLMSLRCNNGYAIAFSVASLSSFVGSLMFGSLVTCFIYLMLALYAYYDGFEL